MKGEHLNFEQRKVINSCITKGKSLKEIGELLDKDPTTISKEIKRNREIIRQRYVSEPQCPRIRRFPYCCNGCNKQYGTCTLSIYRYDPEKAQHKAQKNLVSTRVGLNITDEQFQRVNQIVANGLKDKKSLYDLVHSNEGMPSVSTLYRWIHDGKMQVKVFNLPMAVRYKKRKSKQEYIYSDNCEIDRTNRTYLDYLTYRFNHPGEFTIQFDFLGKIKTDHKNILTLSIPELQFAYLDIIERPTKELVTTMFNQLEERLGINLFQTIFKSLLTDRDSKFIDYLGIEFSHLTGEKRTSIFYCDPYSSWQKGNIENINKQLRKRFPKGRSIDNYTKEEIRTINLMENDKKLRSLSGHSPKEAFIKVFGEQAFNLLFELK